MAHDRFRHGRWCAQKQSSTGALESQQRHWRLVPSARLQFPHQKYSLAYLAPFLVPRLRKAYICIGPCPAGRVLSADLNARKQTMNLDRR